MPAYCAIVNCSNRHEKDNKSFFRLPKLLSTVQSDTGEITNPSLDFLKLLNTRHGRDNKSSFRLPKVIEHQGDKTRELSTERRDK
jgi:hypothetical protein